MYGGQAYGEFGFGEQEDAPLDSSAFVAFLEEIAAPRCWLLEIDVFPLAASSSGSGAYSDGAFGERAFGDGITGAEAAGVTTLRFSTHGYTSQADDEPANTWYEGRLDDPVVVDRRIGSFGGGLVKVFAECRLINQDGGLDRLLTDYAVDGRRARILMGRPTDALADFGVVFSGVMEPPTIGTDVVNLRLSDGSARLTNTVLNATVYAGSGGLEGGADLEGKPKPKGWGHVYNIAPPLVDSATLIYQVNDGAIDSVPAVYDRGVALAEVPGAPGAGEYQVTTSTGTFKLGSTPSGTITCDALLDASGAGYIDTVSDITARILVQVGLASTEIEPASFVQLNTDAPAEVGIWYGAETVRADRVINDLLAGSGAYGGFNRTGAFTVGLIAAPSGTETLSLSSEDIIDITREPLPAEVGPIVWRASAAWRKNYTVQDDLAGSVTAARRTFSAEELRYSTVGDDAIKSRHLLAVELASAAGLYAQSADADTEAARLFALWGTLRALYRITTRPRALVCDLGRTVYIEHPRHGLAAGRLGRVLGHTVRGSEVELLTLC